MNRLTLAVTVSLLNCWLVAQAGEPSPLKSHPNSKSWPDLFAPDLTDAIFPPGVWTWSQGELTPKDKDEVIWSKKDYENFVLDLEFNLEPAANSGVLVYCSDVQNWIPNTLEIQLLDDPASKWTNVPPNWRCGAIFGHSTPRKSAVKKPGQWNRLTIRCQGPHVAVLLNGQLVTDVDMREWKSGKKAPDGADIVDFEPRPLAEMATKGRIGLQGAHGGIPTHFRNIKIKPLD
jgi:hypothetical protein